MNTRIAPGTRVRVTHGRTKYGKNLTGQEGVVSYRSSGSDDGYLSVSFGGETTDPGTRLLRPDQLVVVKATPEPLAPWERALLAGTYPAAVGDHVRITRAFSGTPSWVGQTGTVREVREISGRTRYTVDLDSEARPGYPNGKYAAEVELVVPETPTPATPTPDFTARVQAAEEAHRILSPDADLDRLIGTAEFLLGQRTVGTSTTGPSIGVSTVTLTPDTSAVREAFTQAGDNAATSSPFRGGDSLEVTYDGSTGDVVAVYADGSEYLKPAQVDALITFLQAAQRRFAR